MSNKIKIDVVSDVVCPWCIIGYKRLEQAISDLGIKDKVELDWQPFELNPSMPASGQNLQEHLTEKYGSNEEEQNESKNNLIEYGAAVDFNFNFSKNMKIVNTREAHVLLEYAKENDKQTALNLALVTAYFTDNEDISDKEVLLKKIEELGLDKSIALERLNNPKFLKNIESIENYWSGLGIRSVPTIVFNKQSAVTGAQPVSVFKQVLTDLLKK